MVAMGRLRDWVNEAIGEPYESSLPNEPRPLTDQDLAGWDASLDVRAEMQLKPRTVEGVRALIRHKNPIRWKQFQNNHKWVQKEMKKMGLNPEDARYLL